MTRPLLQPTPTPLRERDGHERAVPAAPEFGALRQRAGLSVRALAREVAPALDGMTEGAARAALAKLESGATETVRLDLYECALDAIYRAIVARDGGLSARDQALSIIANATPLLANAQADLAWVRDSIDQHTAAIALLRMTEGDYEHMAERPARAIATARAALND